MRSSSHELRFELCIHGRGTDQLRSDGGRLVTLQVGAAMGVGST